MSLLNIEKKIIATELACKLKSRKHGTIIEYSKKTAFTKQINEELKLKFCEHKISNTLFYFLIGKEIKQFFNVSIIKVSDSNSNSIKDLIKNDMEYENKLKLSINLAKQYYITKYERKSQGLTFY